MKKKTPKQIRNIEIEEFYSKEFYSRDEYVIYWHYRFNGGKWESRPTPYEELPWIEVNFK